MGTHPSIVRGHQLLGGGRRVVQGFYPWPPGPDPHPLRSTDGINGVNIATLLREHEELRAATNELLLQHDSVCAELIELRSAPCTLLARAVCVAWVWQASG